MARKITHRSYMIAYRITWKSRALSREHKYTYIYISLGIQSPCQMMIGVYNHLLSKVFRLHYHSQKVIGSLGYMYRMMIFRRFVLRLSFQVSYYVQITTFSTPIFQSPRQRKIAVWTTNPEDSGRVLCRGSSIETYRESYLANG